jgi:hypothetical protein
MKKLILLIMMSALLTTIIGCSGGSGSGGSSSNSGSATGSSDPVKQTVESYFTAYYNAQKSLAETTMTGILADNDNILLNEAFRSVELEGKKLLNTRIADYSYQIEYKNVSITGDTAAIDLILDLDYHYANSPDVESGIYNVNYRFTLKNDGSKWMIAGIDSDLDNFKLFKDKVEQSGGARSLSISGQADAILQAKKAMISQFQEVAQSINQSGPATNQSTSSNSSNSTVTVQSIYNVYTNYNYSPSAAAAYAQAYAESKAPNFYKATLDCTNFISQCVWAGYGGTPTLANITNKVRMTSAWYAGTGGGSTDWENVKSFFTYMMSSKILGPQGVTDFSNYNAKHHYTEISPASINIGDVIQYYDGDYCHSSIVSLKGSSNWNQIKVCYHTSDKKNIALSDMFSWTPYIRRLTPSSSRPFEK